VQTHVASLIRVVPTARDLAQPGANRARHRPLAQQSSRPRDAAGLRAATASTAGVSSAPPDQLRPEPLEL